MSSALLFPCYARKLSDSIAIAFGDKASERQPNGSGWRNSIKIIIRIMEYSSPSGGPNVCISVFL